MTDDHQHFLEQKYARSNISFDDFQMKFLDKYKNKLSDHFSPIENRGGEGYIVAINTDRIVEFTNDSISTYTFNVVTSDQDYESFTNLIYFERDNQVGEVIFKYSPTEEWINELTNGNKQPFSGTLSLMSAEGEVIQAEEVIDGNPQGKTAPCLFTAIPIWIDCYDTSCPCPDGNGFFGGWDVSVSCGPSGGGGGTGAGGGDPTGGGGSGSPYGGGDLPTDPVEWGLFMDFVSLRGENDSFDFDHPAVQQYNSIPEFEDFEDFEYYMDNLSADFETVVTPFQDGTHNTKVSIALGILADLDVLVNQRLKNNNQTYLLNSVITLYSGFTIGSNWEFQGFNYHLEGDVVVINIFGELGYNLFLESIGVLYTEFIHYQIKLDANTGDEISITKLD